VTFAFQDCGHDVKFYPFFFSSRRESAMPKSVVEHEIPNAGKLSKQKSVTCSEISETKSVIDPTTAEQQFLA
jgi:hypothetical protein